MCDVFSWTALLWGCLEARSFVRSCFYRSTGLIIHPQAGQAACSHSVGVLATLAHLMVGGWVQSVQESPPQPRSALP